MLSPAETVGECRLSSYRPPSGRRRAPSRPRHSAGSARGRRGRRRDMNGDGNARDQGEQGRRDERSRCHRRMLSRRRLNGPRRSDAARKPTSGFPTPRSTARRHCGRTASSPSAWRPRSTSAPTSTGPCTRPTAGDIASLPLTKLVHEGVIVDVSDCVEDWSVIRPKHITGRMEVKKGDILILHTGYHRYYEGEPQQDLTRYFCMHPGGNQELAKWMHDMQISWWGIDAGLGDHPCIPAFLDVGPLTVEEVRETIGRKSG